MSSAKKKKQEQEPELVARKDLHAQLKKIVADELANLPETLAKMEPAARVGCLLKLLPYVAPKIENVSDNYGEPLSWGWD